MDTTVTASQHGTTSELNTTFSAETDHPNPNPRFFS